MFLKNNSNSGLKSGILNPNPIKKDLIHCSLAKHSLGLTENGTMHPVNVTHLIEETIMIQITIGVISRTSSFVIS